MLDESFEIVKLEKVIENNYNLVGIFYRNHVIVNNYSEELASYQKIIDGATQVMSNLKLYSENDIENYQEIIETQYKIIKLFEMKINKK